MKNDKKSLLHSYIYENENEEDDEDLLIEVDNIKDDVDVEEKKDVIEKDDNENKNNVNLIEPLITDDNNNRNSDKASNRRSKPKFTGEKADEKQMLHDMGFKSQLINTIYSTIHPVDLQEALDYLNTNDNGKFTHSYIENDRFVCAVCLKGRYAHENTALFMDNLQDDLNEENTNTNAVNLNVNLNNNNNNILNNDTLLTSRNSIKFNRFENSYLNSLNRNRYNFNKPKECGICGDAIEYPDSNKVKMICGHTFCADCWENYLQEKINNANVVKISCMQHGCSIVLTKDFIKKILSNNEALIQKYEKFLERQNLLMSNKKIKFCPIPDCDGYAEQKKKEKYVKCNFGHDFCFECLKQPHGRKKCKDLIDKDFEEWKKHKIVKRCPNCKIWTEKNEGCNHMTCVECKFQWCWLCQKKYSSNHYYIGSCKGLQFEREQDENKIKKMLEDNLRRYPVPKPTIGHYICKILKEVLIVIILVFFLPFGLQIKIQDEKRYLNRDYKIALYVISALPTLVAFEIFFFTINLIIMIPGFLFSRKYRQLYLYIRGPFDYD